MFNSISKKLKGEQPSVKKNEDIEGFICPICMASFTSPEMVQKHFDEKHPEDNNAPDNPTETLFSPTTQRKESIRDIQENLNDLRQSLNEEVWYNEELKKECARLNSVILERDKDILNRDRDILMNTKQISEIESARDTLTEELKKMQISRNSLMAENKTIRSDFRVCEEKITELERCRAELLEQSERQQQTHDDLSAEITSIRSLSNVFDDQVPLLNEQLADTKQLLQSKERQLLELSADFDRLKSENDITRGDIEKKCKLLSLTIEQLHTERVTLEQSNVKVSTDLQHSLQISAIECEELRKKVESYRIKLNESEDNLMQMNRKLESNNYQLDDVQTRLNDSTEEVQEIKSQNKELIQRIKNQEVEILQIRNVCSNKDEEIKTLQKGIKNSSDELNSVRQCLDIERKAKDDLQSMVEMTDAANTVMEQIQLEKKSLQEIISTLRTQLEDEIDRSNNELSMTRLEIQSQKEEILNLTSLLSEKDQKIKESEKINTDVQVTCEKYQQKVNDEILSRSSLEDKLMTLTRELRSKEESMNASIESNINLKKEHEVALQQKDEEIDNARRDLSSLNKQVELLNMKASNVETLQKDIEEVNSKVSVLHANLDSMALERDNLLNTTEALKTCVNEFKDKLKSADEYSAALNDSITEINQDLASQLNVIKSKDVLITELQQQIIENTKKINDLNCELKLANEFVVNLREDLSSKEDEIITQKQSIEKLHNDVSQSSGDKFTLESELNIIKDHILEKDQIISQLSTDKEKLKNELIEKENVTKELKEALECLCKEKESDGVQFSMARIQIEETQRLYSDSMRSQNELKNELETVSELLQTANKRLSDLQEEHKRLQSEYSTETEHLIKEGIQLKNHVKAIEKTLNESSNSYKQESLEATERELTLRSHSDELESNMIKLTKSLQRTEDDLENEKCLRQTERNNMMEKISQLTEHVTSSERLKNDLEQRLDTVETDNIEIKIRFEAEKEKLLDNIIQLENNLKKQNEAFIKKCREFDQLQSAILDLGRENQSLQITKEKITSRLWIVDDEAVECHNCHKLFSLTNRKHHCRNCGQVFCQECSAKTATLAVSRRPVRVCDVCHVEVHSHRRRGSTQSISNISVSITN